MITLVERLAFQIQIPTRYVATDRISRYDDIEYLGGPIESPSDRGIINIKATDQNAITK